MDRESVRTLLQKVIEEQHTLHWKKTKKAEKFYKSLTEAIFEKVIPIAVFITMVETEKGEEE